MELMSCQTNSTLLSNVDDNMKLLFILIGCLVLLATAEAHITAARFDDFKVYRVQLEDAQQFSELRKLAQDLPISILNEVKALGTNIDILIDPANQRKLENKLHYLEMKFKCIIEDLQRVIEEQNGGKNHIPPNHEENQLRMNWTHYQKLPTIYNFLDELVEKNPKHITPFSIGDSYEGRPIRGVKVSYKPGRKAIVIDSNIHAIEWISSAVTTYILKHLVETNNEKLIALREKYDFYFLPILNPDGFVYTHEVNRLWRKNRKPTGFTNASGICYGTDLNRNFDCEWGLYAYNTDVPCDHWYAGPKSESEPETQHITKFLKSVANHTGMYLSFHSYGDLVLLPYGYTTEYHPPNYADMLKIAAAYADAVQGVFGTKYEYGASGEKNYIVSGSSKDIAYAVFKIPFTATMELRDKGETGFFLPRNQILDTCKEVFVGLQAMIAEAQKIGTFNEKH